MTPDPNPPASAAHEPHPASGGGAHLPPGRLLALAWRNLWRNRRRTVITLTTIAVGFALAVVSIGLGDGAHNQIIRTSIRTGEGHLTVQPRGYLTAPANHLYLPDGAAIAKALREAGVPGQVAGRIHLQVLASTAANSVGAALQGMAREGDPLVDILRGQLIAGEWPAAGDDRGVVVGRKMADKLELKPGSKLVVMAGTGGGEVTSRLGRVRGIYATGLDELDAFLVATTLSFARPLLPVDDGAPRASRVDEPVTRFAIFLPSDNEDVIAQWKQRLRALDLPDHAVVLDWREMMPQVVNFVIADDIGNYIWLVFILVMVAFSIVNTILMSALERTREFGLLRALGMRPRQVLALMLSEAVLLALASLAVGWVVGGLAHAWLATNGLDLRALYPQGLEFGGMFMEPVMYSELSPGRVATLTAIVFVTTVLGGLYPALRAARVPPTAALAT